VKRLLFLPLLLASCALVGPSTVLPPDPLGATLTQFQTPSCISTETATCITLTYRPGKTGTLNTVAHLKGPKLRLNDTRCADEPGGVLCTFGTVPATEHRVLYVTGYASSTLDADRPDGSKVKISGR